MESQLQEKIFDLHKIENEEMKKIMKDFVSFLTFNENIRYIELQDHNMPTRIK